MSVTDYVIDILLIVVIFRQVRPHELTPRAALLPLALLVAAGIIYLRPFTLRGNDLALILILAAAGIVLGALSGLADRIWLGGPARLMFRAGAISVITWVAGMGFRFGSPITPITPAVLPCPFTRSATTSPAPIPGRPRWS